MKKQNKISFKKNPTKLQVGFNVKTTDDPKKPVNVELDTTVNEYLVTMSDETKDAHE